jgi:hypothetical protein
VAVPLNTADFVAEKVWRRLGPFKHMTYLELMHLARQTLERVEDTHSAIDLLDRTLDPELTYRENLKLLEDALKTKLKAEPEAELQRFIEEKKEWVREQAEALSISKEVEERVRKELARAPPPPPPPASMSKEEAFEYLKRLTPLAEKHRDQFEEEWPTIATLPKSDQERLLVRLAREIERKEVKPPAKPPTRKKLPPIPTTLEEWMERYVPEKKRDFFKRWMGLE